MLGEAEIRELIEDTETRHSKYIKDWLKDPKFKAALHRYDNEVNKERN